MSTDYEAEHFVAQCRRDAARSPIRHIDEVAPPRIITSGSADSYDWTEFSTSGLPCVLRRQAE